VKWPSPSEIYLFAEAFPEMYLLLQIGSGAMAEVGSMERFREAVGWYLPCLDAILIDPSGGKGEPLDAVKGAEYFRAVDEFQLDLGIAGGLGPDTLDLLDPLIEEFSDVSIDVEGRVRTPKPEDALDITKMRGYLTGAYNKLDKPEGGSYAARDSAV
jgi:hypothetical protein